MRFYPYVMKPSLLPDNISYVDYKVYLGMYEVYIPAKLEGLEKLRLEEVPGALEIRRKDGDAFLEKTEVTALVEWKLCVPNPPSPQAPNLPGLTPLQVNMEPIDPIWRNS